MGKRSNFERIERDFYPTPYEAVVPLLPHLSPQTEFYEPCAGDGALVNHLEGEGHVCIWASDIEPRADFVRQRNALTTDFDMKGICITNPPWDRKFLHPFIHFTRFPGCWLLFDADWMHTKQSAEFMPYCKKIVSVGRVKWFPESKMTGKDNCCWYYFQHLMTEKTEFVGRSGA